MDYDPSIFMHRIAPSEKDTATESLEKRLWDTTDQFRANSGLKRRECSGPVLGISRDCGNANC